MPEEKRKINCWIPLSLYKKIESSGFENTTQAIITALERLFEDPERIQEGSSQDTKGSSPNIEALTVENTQLKEDLSGYEKEILGYKRDIEGSKKDLERIQEGYNKDILGYKDNIKALNIEITRLQEALGNAPDPVELAEVRAHFEGLQSLLQEKDERIKDLHEKLKGLISSLTTSKM